VSIARRIQKLRVPLGFLFGILYLLFARPTPGSLLLGGVIALVGVLIRAWAAGHIVKNDRLATTGPYAHTRNPLYFGSFLIAAGFGIAAHWSMLLLVIVFFALVYGPTIRKEREHVRSRFPEAYDEYARNVPAFVPRPLPWRSGEARHAEPFSFALYMRHREWQAGLVFVLVILWLALRSHLPL
jgi:protein-S-isoprenylcysteine O-methyltransferase Ste14